MRTLTHHKLERSDHESAVHVAGIHPSVSDPGPGPGSQVPHIQKDEYGRENTHRGLFQLPGSPRAGADGLDGQTSQHVQG